MPSRTTIRLGTPSSGSASGSQPRFCHLTLNGTGEVGSSQVTQGMTKAFTSMDEADELVR